MVIASLLALFWWLQSDFAQVARAAAEALPTDPARAEALYAKGVALKPDWAEGWFYLGVTRFQQQRLAPAREALQQATRLDPQHGTVWAFLGLTEAGLHDHRAAYEHCVHGEKLGLADDPGFVSTVRLSCARAALAGGAYSNAVEQLQPLAERGDPPDGALPLLGASVLRRPQPGPSPMFEAAGRTAWDLYAHHPEKALPDADQLVKQYGDQPGVHYLRGLVLLQQDPAAADQEFQNELQRDPNSVPARLQLGISSLRRKQYDRARLFGQEAVTREPGNVLAQLLFGRALLESGSARTALPHLETATRLDPEQPQVHLYLEHAYRATGQTQKAEAEKAVYQRLNAARNVPLSQLP